MDYDAIVTQALTLLQREQRLSYRMLKLRLQLDDDTLEALKEELIYAKKLAVDEEGRVLVWTGGTSGAPPTLSPVPLPATSEVSPAQCEATPAIPHTPEAERRQLFPREHRQGRAERRLAFCHRLGGGHDHAAGGGAHQVSPGKFVHGRPPSIRAPCG